VAVALSSEPKSPLERSSAPNVVLAVGLVDLSRGAREFLRLDLDFLPAPAVRSRERSLFVVRHDAGALALAGC
jgi:hypothetical protein